MFFISIVHKNCFGYAIENLTIITAAENFFKNYLFVTDRLHIFVTDK